MSSAVYSNENFNEASGGSEVRNVIHFVHVFAGMMVSTTQMGITYVEWVILCTVPRVLVMR